MSNTFYYDDKQEFDSSFAEEAYYSKNGDLILITTGGNELLYSGVPQHVWSDLIEADSTGNFFQSHIRGVYDYQGESEYYFFQRNPQETATESKITYGDGNVLYDSNSNSTAAPVDSDESGREYVVSATFKTFEEAHVLFSYAEAAAQHASLSVYNSEEVN